MSAGIIAPALAQQTGTKTQIDILDDRITTLEGQNLDGRVSDLESGVFERIILVRNDPLDTVGNCVEFLSVLASITDNDAGNRYLIWLEPGIYDCGVNTVQMKPFIDIQGSGRNVTVIRGNVDGPFLGVVTGADASELRSMRVEHTGAFESAVNAVYTGDTSMRVVDVTAVAQNSMGGATGISVGGTSVLLNVPAYGDNTGAPQAYSANGVFALSGSPELENVNATAAGGSGASDAWALQLYSLAHRLRRIVQAEARRDTALWVDRMNQLFASVALGHRLIKSEPYSH